MQDDKSSSFPFGTAQSDLNALYEQTSTGAVAGSESPPITDSMDNLLANLAEDNANSLPSVSDESVTQNNYEDGRQVNNRTEGEDIGDAVSDASSQPAIAEDIPNGCSEETKADGLDAEMVSEDELPQPAQPKVDDAEEVSDEELPGPKMAELPADTEVVSEDELPSSSKVKRKAEAGYDPNSPTESAETPEKRAKIEGMVRPSFYCFP